MKPLCSYLADRELTRALSDLPRASIRHYKGTLTHGCTYRLQVSLPSWPHSRDTLTVWKRHKFSAIRYGSSDSDSEDDEHDELDELDDSSSEDEEESDVEEATDGRGRGNKKRARVSRSNEEGNGSNGKGRTKSHGSKSESSSADAVHRAQKKGKGRREGNQPVERKDSVAEDDEDHSSMEDSDSDAPSIDGTGIMHAFADSEMAPAADTDLYAFVPAEDQMALERAAPCIRFLLGRTYRSSAHSRS